METFLSASLYLCAYRIKTKSKQYTSYMYNWSVHIYIHICLYISYIPLFQSAFSFYKIPCLWDTMQTYPYWDHIPTNYSSTVSPISPFLLFLHFPYIKWILIWTGELKFLTFFIPPWVFFSKGVFHFGYCSSFPTNLAASFQI